ncbi:Conserved hypothetical protein, integral membrane YwzB [Caldalkalibacillus thermarum TA2.A1]|uniref:DUF1146 family protein n=1 Tax=Caldalkalibacillus thermarum (strain TA2.A1) TaxID=986075 RepID=F5LA58_CALTT|nr:DUF1146 family protein [Caldalkalibacillus thermarum]EGL81778.1 Conserved hypothetical protein, integral membrane YwzB [Caldalkalibacillus thermarum TA2.A1]QZT34153.1 DUF1146 family protein [Caldalkalibacillus thermarum TA2.A1]GGK25672.1 putative membrane protein YwzB [Caldalkalibacillus thermarum]
MLEPPSYLGVQALINMIITLVLIAVSWWVLQCVKLDLFVRDINGPQAKLLQVALAVALGYLLASFFIDYIQWTNWLPYLF